MPGMHQSHLQDPLGHRHRRMLLAHQALWLSIPCLNNIMSLPLLQSLNINRYQVTTCLNQLTACLARLSEVLWKK